AWREWVHILTHNAFGDEEIFGIGTIQKQEILTNAISPLAAVETVQTRRGIGNSDSITFTAPRHSCSCRSNDPCHFMAKASRSMMEEPGMAAPVSLYIGTAGGGCCNLQKYLPGSWSGDGYLLQSYIHWSIKHGCKHSFRRHSVIPYRLCLAGDLLLISTREETPHFHLRLNNIHSLLGETVPGMVGEKKLF